MAYIAYVFRSSNWFRGFWPCDLVHQWNWPLSGTFVFHKHILFFKFFFIYNLLYISISQIERPLGIKTGYKTFRHIHNRKKRQRDTAKHFNQSVVCKLFLPTGTAALTDCVSYCDKILGVFFYQISEL